MNGAATLDPHEEAVRQAAVAERIVLTKADLVSDHATLERLKERLRALNPGAAGSSRPSTAMSPPRPSIGAGLFDLDGKIADVREWLKAEAVAEAERKATRTSTRRTITAMIPGTITITPMTSTGMTIASGPSV